MEHVHKALFLDRDGVIIEDCHLPSKEEDIKIIPGISDLICFFRKNHFKVFIVTNQTVVSRGILSLDKAYALNDYILKILKANNPEAIIDQVYLCPHHPNANIEEYKVKCACRKPGNGMLIQANKEFDISLNQSLIIGDRPTDIYAGKSVGCKGILLKSGRHGEDLLETHQENLNNQFFEPDFTFSSVQEILEYFKKSHI